MCTGSSRGIMAVQTVPLLKDNAMLRVRPIHFTSRTDSWKQFLAALGMVETEDDGGWHVFDSASGRLALHGAEAGSGQDGHTVFAVEVGDVAEFARRTNLSAQENGTQAEGAQPAELVTVAHGEACRISAPDGFSFMADKAAHGAQCADADPALAVVAVWYTADPEGAVRTLLHVGARPRPVPDNDETADFGPAWALSTTADWNLCGTGSPLPVLPPASPSRRLEAPSTWPIRTPAAPTRPPRCGSPSAAPWGRT